MLTTSKTCVWTLQALLGVERMPTPLRLKPFIPSAHGDLIVETTQGRQPLQATAEYHDLMRIGVVDERGQVDDVVRDWMTVLSRAEREVMLVIRRPNQPATDDTPRQCMSESWWYAATRNTWRWPPSTVTRW